MAEESEVFSFVIEHVARKRDRKGFLSEIPIRVMQILSF